MLSEEQFIQQVYDLEELYEDILYEEDTIYVDDAEEVTVMKTIFEKCCELLELAMNDRYHLVSYYFYDLGGKNDNAAQCIVPNRESVYLCNPYNLYDAIKNLNAEESL